MELASVRFGNKIKVDAPSVNVPLFFHICDAGKYHANFIKGDIVLIGMDILRMFNFGISFDKSMFSLEKPLRDKPQEPASQCA